MSYAASAALQRAVYQRLITDPIVSTLVKGNIYDAVPEGPLPKMYATLGPERVLDAGTGDAGGSVHDFVVTLVTSDGGFQSAKDAAGAISDALVDASLTLTRGRLVGLWFRRATAAREGAGLRRIDMTFRARIEDV